MGDFYDVLNIPKGATPDQIRKAYKALVRQWHPDKHPPSSKNEAETKFKCITQAYVALSDGECRPMFGVCNNNNTAGAGAGAGGSSWEKMKQKQKQQKSGGAEDRVGRNMSARKGSSNGYNYHPTTNSTSSPVTGAPGTTTFFRRKPPPIEKRLECTLEELFRGCKKEVRYTRDVLGTNGRILEKEEVQTVRVKPGWRKGTKVTFEEKGDERFGSIPSDVIFSISEKEHPYFRRSGNDLVMKVEVPLVDALTGWRFSFRLLSGERMSCVEESIVPGYVRLIEGEGMPVPGQKGVRGDLRIKFHIVFPKRLSEQEKIGIKYVLRDCN